MTPFPSFRGSAHTAPPPVIARQCALLALRAAYGGCALHSAAALDCRGNLGRGTALVERYALGSLV